MTDAISGKSIAGGALGGDDDWETDHETGLRRRKRQRLTLNRYGDIDLPPTPPKPTPVYDGLSPEKRLAVDRLTALVLLQQKQGGL